jgi:4-hydroxy 2-oxovalerate aldolase
MRKVSILDCTLRDGGYINDFKFGRQTIIDMIDGLGKASIDIIECGFLKSGCSDKDQTLFSAIETIKDYIGEKAPNSIYVAMIQYGAIKIDEICDYDGKSVDGIRITFHEHEIEQAFTLGKGIMNKGYKVFMQPVGTTSYEDAALIYLIKKINALKPYAFYMVDTLGTMYKNDLLRMFYIVDHNLDKRIALGFHSHNNLQMSFANAQELAQINTTRNLIIDSSVLGMGRGAGNLNTELLVQYLNVNQGLKYDVFKIMNLMDQYIKPLSVHYKWGYDAAYYLAAVSECHPNYASFLLNRQTLQIRDIGTILNGLDPQKRSLFDKKYIQEEYRKYMDYSVDDTEVCEHLKAMVGTKKILLIAPGKSIKTETVRVNQLIADDTFFVVSINFFPEKIPIDLIFISNMKRFQNTRDFSAGHSINTIVTSNIKNAGDRYWIVNYSSYLNEESTIADNAGIMCINLLKKIGAKEFLLAGFDGFSDNIKENFYEESLYFDVEEERLAKMNIAMANKIAQLRKQVTITFFAPSTYDAKNIVSQKVRGKTNG